MVPQLHVHVVGRYKGDPAWPGPVWGHSDPVRHGPEGAGGQAGTGKVFLTIRIQFQPMKLSGLSSEHANVVTALQNAAAATGSDFNYLLGTAMRESGLKAGAQSATSSATGLFQFIDQTWLGLVKDHGAAQGLSAQAGAISKGADGRYHAGAEQDAILALRKDPGISALMAGEYAKSTSASLSAALGRPVCGGELYAAHFLGPDAACKLIKLAGSDPGTSAAAQFPAAAAANKSVFFHPDGTAKSVREVYDWALRQPGAAGTQRAAPQVLPQSPGVSGRRRRWIHDIQMLISSVLNWQPGSYFWRRRQHWRRERCLSAPDCWACSPTRGKAELGRAESLTDLPVQFAQQDQGHLVVGPGDIAAQDRGDRRDMGVHQRDRQFGLGGRLAHQPRQRGGEAGHQGKAQRGGLAFHVMGGAEQRGAWAGAGSAP